MKSFNNKPGIIKIGSNFTVSTTASALPFALLELMVVFSLVIGAHGRLFPRIMVVTVHGAMGSVRPRGAATGTRTPCSGTVEVFDVLCNREMTVTDHPKPSISKNRAEIRSNNTVSRS